jgi:hypothetical protein
MGDRYHYDKHGNYKGKSSSKPPGSDVGGCVALIFIIFLISRCSSSTPSKSTQQHQLPTIEHQFAMLAPK